MTICWPTTPTTNPSEKGGGGVSATVAAARPARSADVRGERQAAATSGSPSNTTLKSSFSFPFRVAALDTPHHFVCVSGFSAKEHGTGFRGHGNSRCFVLLFLALPVGML